MLGHSVTLVAHGLLQERIDDELFGDGMPRNLPGELVGPFGLGLLVGSLHIFVVVSLNL